MNQPVPLKAFNFHYTITAYFTAEVIPLQILQARYLKSSASHAPAGINSKISDSASDVQLSNQKKSIMKKTIYSST
jgi:hypothetical protein